MIEKSQLFHRCTVKEIMPIIRIFDPYIFISIKIGTFDSTLALVYWRIISNTCLFEIGLDENSGIPRLTQVTNYNNKITNFVEREIDCKEKGIPSFSLDNWPLPKDCWKNFKNRFLDVPGHISIEHSSTRINIVLFEDRGSYCVDVSEDLGYVFNKSGHLIMIQVRNLQMHELESIEFYSRFHEEEAWRRK